MNIKKIFAKMVKAYGKGENVTVVTDYSNATCILKHLLSMPETYVAQILIASREYDGYDGAFYVNLDEDGEGNLYIVYDRERCNSIKLNRETWISEAAKEIILCKITADDVINSALSEGSFLRKVISRAKIDYVEA